MNRLLVLLGAVALAACGADTDDGDVVEEPAEEVYESVSDQVRRPLEEAEEVEAIVRDRAAALEDAVEAAGAGEDPGH